MCIDIVEIWFGSVMGKFCEFLTELSAHHRIVAGHYHFTFFLNKKQNLGQKSMENKVFEILGHLPYLL